MMNITSAACRIRLSKNWIIIADKKTPGRNCPELVVACYRQDH